jgi:hypothetical protein
MILPKIIGQVRLPVVLAALNVALLAVFFSYLAPLSSDLEFRRNNTQNSSMRVRASLDVAAMELENLAQSGDAYAKLLEQGFLDPQDRLEASKLLDRLRKANGLTSISYEIAPEKTFDDPVVRNSGFTVTSTRITITMEGLLDTDLIEFVRAVVDELPGQVRLVTLILERLSTPTDESLAILRDGRSVDLVTGEAVIEWRTLRPPAEKTVQQS